MGLPAYSVHTTGRMKCVTSDRIRQDKRLKLMAAGPFCTSVAVLHVLASPWQTPLEEQESSQQASHTAGSPDNRKRTEASQWDKSAVVRWQVGYEWRFHSEPWYHQLPLTLIFCLCSIFRREAFTKVLSDIFIHTRQPVTCGWGDESQKYISHMMQSMYRTHTPAPDISLSSTPPSSPLPDWGERESTPEDVCSVLHGSVCNLSTAWAAPLCLTVWGSGWEQTLIHCSDGGSTTNTSTCRTAVTINTKWQ